MYRDKRFEVSCLRKALSELIPYVFKSSHPLKGWIHEGKEIELPYEWEGLRTSFEIELALPPKTVGNYLKAWFGGETLIRIDGVPYGEINEYHRTLNLDEIADGKRHLIRAEVVCRGLFGKPEKQVFSEAFLYEEDSEIRRVVNFVERAIDLIEHVEDERLLNALLDLTDRFLSSIQIPRSTEEYLKSAHFNPYIREELSKMWSAPDLPEVSGFDSGRFKEDLMKAFEDYREGMRELRDRFGKLPSKMHLVGHSHIDYTWLWPMEETLNKILRTFSNSVLLARKYPFFRFSQSSAQMYENVKELSPELFEKIKSLVREGRWEPIGGMWVESDANIPSMESLVRQFYYGQKFFEREFGKRSSVCWLPDVFGFSWILPQILKDVGIELFVTTKLNWNESNDFPYDLCIWRGIDGSEVIYYSFENPVGGYNARIVAKALRETHFNFKQLDLTPHLLLSFGYGDGGGGPTEEMCESYLSYEDMPAVPEMEMDTVENFKDELLKSIEGKELPRWDGPLYLELHRGTYTSQSRTKVLHKKMEDSLRSAEILNTLLSGNVQHQIDEIWKILLRNENHDLLPGSSIREVHMEAEEEMEKEVEKLQSISKSLFKSRSTGEKDYLTVFNPSSFPQKLHLEIDEPLKLHYEGEELEFQPTHDGKYVYSIDRMLKPLSFSTLEIRGVHESDIKPFDNSHSMENEYLSVEVLEDGSVQIELKENGRYVFKGSGNILVFYKNIPPYWDNWDIDVHHEKASVRLKAKSIEKVESGPVREVIKVEYEIEGSEIEQYYTLWKGLPYLGIRNEIDWHSRRAVLKAVFPMSVLTRFAKLDIDGGYFELPTHRNTNFERARFEVPHQRWFDLSQRDFGVSIFNNARYGCGFKESTATLTLIKAGIFPDFFADEGKHIFSYAIYPHVTSDLEGTVRLADNFNKGLMVFEGRLSSEPMYVELEGGTFKILSFKKDGWYTLRIVEVLGESGKGIAHIEGVKISEIFRSNVLEDPIEKLEFDGKRFEFEYSPFKMMTFIFK